MYVDKIRAINVPHIYIYIFFFGGGGSKVLQKTTNFCGQEGGQYHCVGLWTVLVAGKEVRITAERCNHGIKQLKYKHKVMDYAEKI